MAMSSSLLAPALHKHWLYIYRFSNADVCDVFLFAIICILRASHDRDTRERIGVPANKAYGTIMSATVTVAGTLSGSALITSAPTGTDPSSSGKGTNTKSEATSTTASGNGVVIAASPLLLLGGMLAALQL